MSDDLFPIPEVLSPKLAWLKKHRLKTYTIGDQWRCVNSGYTWVGAGNTEDEAILDYCERHNLKHYSLES